MISDLPEDWQILNFTDCIEKTTSSNKLKVPKKDYLKQGAYPIIDQSVDFIAGYTNNTEKVFQGDLPIIIFGDHTRIFKYIDFPFSLGADGTKIIIPKKELFNVKYLYYFLKGLKIEDHGYDRHYKYLKNKKIVIPPIETQKKIVEILEKAEKLKEWRAEADELADEYLKSVFDEMFGDPFRNPKGWKIEKLGDLSTKITDGVHAKPNYTEEGVPFISVVNCNSQYLKFENCKFISKEDHIKYFKRCNPEINDIIYTKVGATYGIASIVDKKREFSLYVSVALIKPKHDKINSVFLKHLMNSKGIKHQANMAIRGIGVPDLHLVEIKKFKIILPPMDLQEEFADIVKKHEKLKYSQAQSKQEIDNLFNTLMQKAFKGELVC